MGWFSDLKKKIKKASSKGYNNYKKSQSKKSKKAVKSSYGELVKSTQKKSTAKSSSKSSSSKSKMAAQAAVKVAAEKKAQREATERKRKKDQALKAAQATKSASENLTKMREKQKKNSLTKLSQGVTAVSAYKKANENVYKPMKNIETARKIEREKAEKREAERNKGTTKLSQGGTVTNIYKRANKSVHEPVKNIEAVKKQRDEAKAKRIEDVKKAIDKAKNTDALGLNTNSKKYEETHSYKTNNNLEKNAAKFKLILDYKNQLQEQLKKSEYSHLSEKQKKEIISKMLNEGRGDIDKIINEAYPDKVKYRNMTMNEHLKFQNATRTAGGDAKLASKMLDDKLKDNLAKLYSSNYKNSAFGTGAAESFSPIDVQNYMRNLTRDKDGNSRLDEKTIQQAENSLAYEAGSFLGLSAGAMTTGVGGAAEKVLGKNIAKSLLKSTAKDSVKKAAIKKFAAERMADVALSSSYDAIDSLKGAVDEKGNIDWKQAAKNMGENAASNVVFGGVLDLGIKGVKKGAEGVKKGTEKGIEKLKSNAIGKGTDINKLTKEEFNQTIKLMAKEKAGNKLSVSEKEVLNSNLAKAKKGAIKNAEEKAIADIRAKAYNENGGKIDENRQMGKTTISTDTGRTADIRQVDERVSGGEGYDRARVAGTAGKEELGRTRGFHSRVLDDNTRIKMNDSGISDTKLRETSTENAVFSNAMNVAVKANKHGSYVDLVDADEMTKAGTRTFLSEDSSTGFAIKSDGDIVALFKNSGSKHKNVTNELLISARANGGIKMDCYGKRLVNKYENAGYIPVARVPFNPKYVDDSLLLKDKPDVYVMMKNTDDLDTVIDNVAIGGYKKSSQAELDSLPTFKDYDEALKYRDDLLYKQEQNTSDVAAHKQESKTGNDENFLTPEQKARLDEKLKEANGGKTSDEYIAENKNKIENKIIKEENPTSETFQEKAYTKAGREKEVKEQFIQTHKKTYEANSKEIQKVFDDVSEKYHKIRGITKKEAIQKSSEELKSKGINQMYDDYMDTKVADMVGEEMLFASRSKTLFDELAKYPDDVEMMRKLQNVEEFFCHWASSQGRGLNAVKLFLNSTPAGKLRILEKDLAFINKYFGDRLKEPIKFTDEQIAMIQRTKDMTEDEVRSVINTLNTQIWEQIPATLFERLNEFRRFSMLANPKTHIRNLAGNSVFALGRTVSDYIEVKMMKSGAVKKAVAKRNPDAKIRMVDVSNVERKEAKDFIYNEFDKRYENMDSAVKWRDDVSGSSESVRLSKTRPDSVQTSRFKHLDKGEKFNYKALDKEDLIFMKPAYNNAYIRFCKSEGIAAKDIKNINKEFADRAHSYAFAEAERVCFRDTTYLSKKITSAKDWTLRNGKTKAGTVGRRALNVALESTVPFIKTPINIFSRSVDYSPLGMARGLFELATSSKNAYRFMDGIHHISTGLTGTGVFVFGAWAYNAGFVTLEAGNKSGDAYYDRDMGFQDYSINVLGYSYTIDWLSPMQTSFFMGGAAMQAFQNKGNLFEDLVNGLASITNPMLDMSFMSTPKDMADTFLETTYNGDGVGAAVIRVVLGDVPQGYLSGFTPQIFSQTAGVFDKYKRDTSSTSDNPLVADWQSFFKQQANKIPGIRNVTLNKKLDSRGNPINTGDNVFMRIANAYVNPSNVSKIRFDKYDKELIKTYNEMSDGEGKEKFWYNFTGNPSYDLANGKRMTYDEKYSYARTSRQKQFGYIKDMIDSKRYGGMSADMKATEIKDYSFLSQSQADKKVYGVKYAIERIGETGSDGDKKAIKLLDESYKNGVFGNKTKKQSYDEFFNFYTSKEKILAKSHDSSYGTKAFALANFSNGNKEVENRYAAIFDIHLKNVDKAKEYIKKGGTEEEFTNSMCSIQSVIKKADANSRTGNKAVALSKGSLKIPQRFAECINLTGKQQNMGYGLDKVYNYSFARLDEMYMMAKFDYDKDRNGYLNQKEVKAYIDSLGLKDNTEKALLFVYFKGDSKNNPYGSIPNYLGLDNYNGGGGGSSRKSYGSRRGRSGKSSASSSKKTSMQSWEEYLKDYLSNLSDVDGVNFKNWDSPLDAAYRSKINSILKKTKVKQS